MSCNAENVLPKYVFMVPYNLAGSGFRSRLNAELTGIPTSVSHTSGPDSQDQMTASLSQPLSFYSNFQYSNQNTLKMLFSLNLILHQQGQLNTKKVNETAEWKMKTLHRFLEISPPTAETERLQTRCSASGPYRKVDKLGIKELTCRVSCRRDRTSSMGYSSFCYTSGSFTSPHSAQ